MIMPTIKLVIQRISRQKPQFRWLSSVLADKCRNIPTVLRNEAIEPLKTNVPNEDPSAPPDQLAVETVGGGLNPRLLQLGAAGQG